MPGEEWARRILQKELGQTVLIHDDGSSPGMYDLRIGPANEPEVAIECVGAVDETYTKTWNTGPAKGPLQLAVAGDWHVVIAPAAHVKTLKRHLEKLLAELVERGVYSARPDHWLERRNTTLFNKLNALGIIHAFCYQMPGIGRVNLSMPGSGGAVDDKGGEVPNWLGDFLRDPAREDVLSKLQRSGAKECYAFVIATLRGAPWAVESYLTGELDHVPSEAPDLPLPVTAVWVVSVFSHKGLYWDGNTWRIVEARGEGISDQPSN